MDANVEELADKFANLNNEKVSVQRVRKLMFGLESNEKKIADEMKSVMEKKTDLEKSVAGLHSVLKETQHKLELQKQEEYAITGERYKAKLYNKCTKTVFDLNAPDNKVIGFMRLDTGIKTFDLDASKQSEFAISQRLWCMLEHKEEINANNTSLQII